MTDDPQDPGGAERNELGRNGPGPIGLRRVWPPPASESLDDEGIADLYESGVRPWLRVNFVSSIDGSATHAGLSGGLSGEADKRVFEILRRLCDVVLVGAGTVRAEGYGAMQVDEASQAWRLEHGLSAHPAFAIVSASLNLDAASGIFADAPMRPVVLTVESAPAEARHALSAVADVVDCGRERVDPAVAVAALIERGLDRVHCEGGPHLFGDLVAAGLVDELCLTVSPVLEGGDGPRISAGAAPDAPVGLALAHILVEDDALLLRYTRPAPDPQAAGV